MAKHVYASAMLDGINYTASATVSPQRGRDLSVAINWIEATDEAGNVLERIDPPTFEHSEIIELLEPSARDAYAYACRDDDTPEMLAADHYAEQAKEARLMGWE